MSSLSPLPSSAKRPSFNEFLPVTNSLSPSGKQSITKTHRHQVGGAHRLHSRNTSLGKPAGKAGKTTSAQNPSDEGARHQRKKPSISSVPPTSPRIPAIKRNNSHVALVKNTSQVHLRKNKSANALARNLSHTQLHRKTGPGPSAPKPRKQASKKQKGFQLGEKSSDEEFSNEEAEWEDSATQSPKLTRSNSDVSSKPARPISSERAPAGGSSTTATQKHNTPSPPEPLLRQNRSAPNFGAGALSAFPARPPDQAINPTFLQYNPRSSRAPPAISSISAQASRDRLPRSNSSFTHISHADANSSHNAFLNTPNTGNSAGASSSADGAVSHFLSTQPASSLKHQRRTSSGSDYGSPSSFLPHYHPQQSISPDKARLNGPIGSPGSMKKVERPSRTQQRLELQRRETMRTAGITTPAMPLIVDGRRGSVVSLHSRSASHGRNRGTDPASAAAARLMIKQDYEAAERQLAVVRIFRNPVVEAVERLKEAGVLVLEKKSATSGGGGREQDKRKKGSVRKGVDHDQNAKSDPNLKVERGPGSSGGGGVVGSRSSFEESDATPHTARPDQMSRNSSHGRPTRSGQVSATAGKVRFQRQGSHDDIGLSRSQGSDEDDDHNRKSNHDGNGNNYFKPNHNISGGQKNGEDHGHDNDGDGDGGGDDGGGGGGGRKDGARSEGTMSAEEEMMRRMWEGGEVGV